MKKITFFLLFFLMGSIGYAQMIPGTNVKKRKEYMMKTYKIHRGKADAYEQILANLQRDNDLLKSRKMTSAQFRSKQQKLYKKYGDKISQLFSKGRFRSWSILTQELERYQVLSENKFIPRDNMRALHKAESSWEEKRNNMRKSSIGEDEKFKKEDAMLDELNKQICQILGNENGNWYIIYKRMELVTLDNMDKYGTSYKDAYSITQIEDNYRQKRTTILSSSKKHAEKEVDFMANDRAKEQEIASSVPADVTARWKKVNNAMLDNILKTRYGLGQSQITNFKKAYNKYAIDEYKILSQKQVPPSERYSQLAQLSENFQKTVQPYFQTTQFTKWQGWWKYNFNKTMKRKGLK